MWLVLTDKVGWSQFDNVAAIGIHDRDAAKWRVAPVYFKQDLAAIWRPVPDGISISEVRDLTQIVTIWPDGVDLNVCVGSELHLKRDSSVHAWKCARAGTALKSSPANITQVRVETIRNRELGSGLFITFSLSTMRLAL